jgi:hypothetical protein
MLNSYLFKHFTKLKGQCLINNLKFKLLIIGTYFPYLKHAIKYH